MYFENFHEDIGSFDESILTNFKSQLFSIDRSNPLLDRPEHCFQDGGRLIMPMHYGQVLDLRYYSYVQPLIELIKRTNHHSIRDSVPFRIEISIIEPGKAVKWHVDQHLYHKFSERIHIPIITNDSVEFVSKWFTDDRAYKFTMQPGHFYRYNNRVLHTVKNPCDEFRCHVMVDFIKRPIFDYFAQGDNHERLGTNTIITPRDEIYYLVNPRVNSCEPYEYTDEDLRQLEEIKNYYVQHQSPRNY